MALTNATLLESLTSEQLQSIPALLPPPGVTPNFHYPASIEPQIVGLASAAITISTVMFTIRCYNKLFITRKLKWDDLTCTLGYLFILPGYIGTMIATIDGPLGKHQYEQHLSDLLIPQFLISSIWVHGAFSQPMLLFVRITFFLMYLDIFSPFRWMKICCRAGGIVCAIYYTGASVAQIIFVTPSIGETFLEKAVRETRSNSLSIPSGVVGLVLDIYLFILPLIAISQLNLPSRQKIGTSMLFGTGILAIISSSLSIYYRYIWSTDVTWTTALSQIALMYEGCFGLICTCMPSIAKITQRYGLVRRASAMFSHVTRPLQSLANHSSPENASETIALSQPSAQGIHITFNSTSVVADIEPEVGKAYPYNIQAIATEPIQTIISAGHKPADHEYV